MVQTILDQLQLRFLDYSQRLSRKIRKTNENFFSKNVFKSFLNWRSRRRFRTIRAQKLKGKVPRIEGALELVGERCRRTCRGKVPSLLLGGLD